MRARAGTPLLLTALGFVGLGGLAGWRLALREEGAARAFGAAAFAVYVAWLLWESRISVGELGKDEADHDRGTMELCAAAKIAVLACAFGFGTGGGGGAPVLRGSLGIATMLAGILVRAAAIRRLGRAYGHRIRPLETLIERGPYAIVRHPAYLGTLLAHTGLVLVFLNPWSLAALILLWYPSVIWRTVVEDRFLFASAPESYAPYAARVRARLFPAIW